MNRIYSSILAAIAFIAGVQLTACNKSSDKDSGGGSSFGIPNASGPVATTSAQALGLKAVDNVVQSAAHKLVGGSSPTGAASFPFIAGQMHFTISKIPDATSCLVEALVNNGLVSTDGKEFVFDDTDNNEKTKITVTASGNTPSSFSIRQCSSGSQVQYLGGSLTGEDMSFTFKGSESSNKYALTITGKYNGTTWTSKQVTIYSYAASQYSVYRTTQYADALVPQYTTSGVKLYAKYTLSGSSTQDYAMGAGSYKYNMGGSDSLGHWTSDLADTSTASPYATEVAAGTFLTAITSFTSYEISGSEAWDCQTGSASVLSATTVSSAQAQAVTTALNSCLDGL